MPLAFGAAGAAIGLAPVFWITAMLLAAGSVYARRTVATAPQVLADPLEARPARVSGSGT
jgi:hypothetical protein